MKSVLVRLFIAITAIAFALPPAHATTLGAISGGNVLNTYADSITINGDISNSTVKLTSTGGGITVKGKVNTADSIYFDARGGAVKFKDSIDSSSVVVFTTGNTTGCTGGSDSDKDKDKDKDKDDDDDDSSSCSITFSKGINNSNVVVKSSTTVTIKGSITNSSVVTWCGTSLSVQGSVDASSTTTKVCP